MGQKTRHILSLSGGKDSTALAIFMRDKIPEMEYVFCDTDKELRETYEYLNYIEAYLGKKIIRLNAAVGFDHWHQVFGGYLPSPSMRWCTRQLKLKPFEEFVRDDPIISYVGIRADEDRVGYISHKPNIRTVYPLKEAGIDYAGVIKILEDSGIGLPPYLKWGRTHSGCYFCFFQKPIEWVRLLETYPEDFDKAQAYEKVTDQPGKTFTWIQGMPLSELRKPKNVKKIKRRYAETQERYYKARGNKTLVEVLAELDVPTREPTACLICHL
ncbi:MAG: phosphoadenosine phosphosulfate reductase family protein [Deltaproteobacteria bacterium]|nr:phosphoadenosine phosphosulfate reductase family protein [Deltaproteobacteria bacterium]